MYVAPDGGRHYLVDLPGRDNGTFSNPNRYTKSGTFLRLRKTDASTVLVEFPDGLVSEFRKTGDTAAGTDFCGGGVSGCWRLHETRDLYGNGVSFSYDLTGTVETWTVTDSTGRKHERDFIHGPSGLIATRRHNGMVRYFHADHLGTPRLYTATDGKVFSRKDYYPFGAEIEDASEVLLDGFEDGDTRYWLESKDERRVEWTGHERDPHGLTDYMLARTCLYPFYRFGSVDPARDGWNLYSYARNNPVAFTDPTGEESAGIVLDNDVEAFLEGEITQEQYMDRVEARGKAALVAVTLFTPGPEELLALSILKAGRGFLAKLLGPQNVSRATKALHEIADEIRTSGHPIAAERRTIAVGQDSAGRLHVGSSNGLDQGQRAAAERMNLQAVPSRRGLHAEEELLQAVPDLKAIGTSRRPPCGPGERNCAGQLAARGVRVTNHVN